MKKRQREITDQDVAKKLSVRKDLKKNGSLYLLFLPVAIYLIIFNYVPMTGILMAFEKYSVKKGWFASAWVGFENFRTLFSGNAFSAAMRNTVCMAVLNLVFSFFPPIILAILFSECRWKRFKRGTQLITYLPYFISAVVVCGLLQQFFKQDGPLTLLLCKLGFENQNWLANNHVPVFWIIYALAGVWVGMGWNSIVYSTAISNVNRDLKEAAALDGANRWQRVRYIVLPSLVPLCMMLLTMSVGTMFMAGWDKVLLLYMPKTYSVADCLYTYTYRMAFGTQINYGVATASGLFQSVIGTVLLLVSNKLNKKATGHALY